MVEIDIDYEGDLHCRLVHGPSGNAITTDAPKDNMGRGETFSPTDLVAAALGSCMLTVMGIVANRHQINLKGAHAHVAKEMTPAPNRRIAALTVDIDMPSQLTPEQRKMLEHAAHTCPVHKSLHPDVQVAVRFSYHQS